MITSKWECPKNRKVVIFVCYECQDSYSEIWTEKKKWMRERMFIQFSAIHTRSHQRRRRRQAKQKEIIENLLFFWIWLVALKVWAVRWLSTERSFCFRCDRIFFFFHFEIRIANEIEKKEEWREAIHQQQNINSYIQSFLIYAIFHWRTLIFIWVRNERELTTMMMPMKTT